MTKLEFLRIFEENEWEIEETGRRLCLKKDGVKLEKIFFNYKQREKWKKGYTFSVSTTEDDDWFMHDEYKATYDRFHMLVDKGE